MAGTVHDTAVTGAPLTGGLAMDATTMAAAATETMVSEATATEATMVEATAMEGVVHVMPGVGEGEYSSGGQAESMEVDDGDQPVLTEDVGGGLHRDQVASGDEDGKSIRTQREVE